MKPKVRFVLELNFTSKAQKDKCLALYGEKFFKLIKEAKSKKYFASDYSTLDSIRKLLIQYNNVNNLVPSLHKHLEDASILKLTEVAPLFNLAPTDLQAYILMSLGMRIYTETN